MRTRARRSAAAVSPFNRVNIRKAANYAIDRPALVRVSGKFHGTVGTRGADFDAYVGGWVADYPDPFDFINVLPDGGNIQESNNSNYAYFNDAKFNKQMNDFAKLSGPNRYLSYGKLDLDIIPKGPLCSST